MATSHTTQEITDLVEGKLLGPGDLPISGAEQTSLAQPGHVTFIGDRRHARRWPDSLASAALVTRGIEVEPRADAALIFVENADLAMAKTLNLFAPDPILPGPGIHPSAVVDPSASLAADVRVGPQCVIGAQVVIGAGCVLHAGVVVMDDSRLGKACVVWPHVTIRERCILGDRCIVHPGVVIGSDGFGYRPGPANTAPEQRGTSDEGAGSNQPSPPIVPIKIPQIGIVRIGNDVEIGAGTCIDRAKFSATFIDDHTKIDNLVQIAHNCRIGKGVIIAGCVALAGSVTLGDGVTIGGRASIKDHVKMGAGATLVGAANLANDVPPGQVWGGSPAVPLDQAKRQVIALRKLPDLVKRLKAR